MKEKATIYGSVMKHENDWVDLSEINYTMKHSKDDVEWLLVYMLSRTGRRISELLELKPKHINFRYNTILWHILKKKNNKDYHSIQHITDEVLKVLEGYIYLNGIKKEDFVFKSTRNPGKSFTRFWAYKRIRTLFERVGVYVIANKPAHPHMFRHSFAINFLLRTKHPAALKFLKDQLHHSSLNVTSFYMKFDQKEHIKVLNEVFKDAK